MANYNTFVVVDCKSRKSILTTSSARKAYKLLAVGVRVDVWNENLKIETVYGRDMSRAQGQMRVYIEAEREYVRQKQARAEDRNRARRERLERRSTGR